jgi:hypothetical protein
VQRPSGRRKLLNAFKRTRASEIEVVAVVATLSIHLHRSRIDRVEKLIWTSLAQIHGEHLVFLTSKGELAALFLLEIVEDWSELFD